MATNVRGIKSGYGISEDCVILRYNLRKNNSIIKYYKCYNLISFVHYCISGTHDIMALRISYIYNKLDDYDHHHSASLPTSVKNLFSYVVVASIHFASLKKVFVLQNQPPYYTHYQQNNYTR